MANTLSEYAPGDVWMGDTLRDIGGTAEDRANYFIAPFDAYLKQVQVTAEAASTATLTIGTVENGTLGTIDATSAGSGGVVTQYYNEGDSGNFVSAGNVVSIVSDGAGATGNKGFVSIVLGRAGGHLNGRSEQRTVRFMLTQADDGLTFATRNGTLPWSTKLVNAMSYTNASITGGSGAGISMTWNNGSNTAISVSAVASGSDTVTDYRGSISSTLDSIPAYTNYGVAMLGLATSANVYAGLFELELEL